MEPGRGIQYDFGNGEDDAESADDEDDDIGTIWKSLVSESQRHVCGVEEEGGLRTSPIPTRQVTKRVW